MIQSIDAEYWKSIADLPDGFERINRSFLAIMAERDEAKELALAAARGHSAQLSASRALKERVDELIAANNREIAEKRKARGYVKALTCALANCHSIDDGARALLKDALEYLGWDSPDGPAIPGNKEGEM